MSRDLSRVVIHHSASGRGTTREQIYDWHVNQRGWADIGYHYICLASGKVVPGRAFHLRGAHAGRSGNDYTGIVGTGWNGSSAPRANMGWSDKQIAGIQAFLDGYRILFPGSTFDGHDKYKATLCPGLDVHRVFR